MQPDLLAKPETQVLPGLLGLKEIVLLDLLDQPESKAKPEQLDRQDQPEQLVQTQQSPDLLDLLEIPALPDLRE